MQHPQVWTADNWQRWSPTGSQFYVTTLSSKQVEMGNLRLRISSELKAHHECNFSLRNILKWSNHHWCASTWDLSIGCNFTYVPTSKMRGQRHKQTSMSPKASDLYDMEQERTIHEARPRATYKTENKVSKAPLYREQAHSDPKRYSYYRDSRRKRKRSSSIKKKK